MNIPDMKVPLSGLNDRVVPDGTYNLRVHKAEFVPVPKTAAANPYIHTWLAITGPDDRCVGRMVFMNYPIAGDNTYLLKELLSVTGHGNEFVLESPQQLIGLEFRALVSVVEAVGDWPAKNSVRKHLPIIE
jgi:hypothetical protein